jgi:hypothetical protein
MSNQSNGDALSDESERTAPPHISKDWRNAVIARQQSLLATGDPFLGPV